MQRTARLFCLLPGLLLGAIATSAFAGDAFVNQALASQTLIGDKSPSTAGGPQPLLQPGSANALSTAACTRREVPTDAQGRVKVGTEVALQAQSPDYAATKAGMNLVWRQVIDHPGASYIAPHFSRFNLPKGAAAVVRSPDSSRMWTYTGQGKPRFGDREGFWGIHIPGSRALVEVYSRHPIGKGAVRIDGYARGFGHAEMGAAAALGEPEAICGQDDSNRAQCYIGTDAYTKGRAVARLLINGSSACTGWLVGSEGHLMTNNHCVATASEANNTDYEFMAEGSCNQNCESWFACPGTVEATSASLVKTSSPLDYTLVKLPSNVSTTYGYLQMRSSGAVLDERIYIPQHAAAWGKRIAIESGATIDDGVCRATSLDSTPCSGGPGDVGYMCDTRGGSSGSPVLGYGDNTVVALHHCANCPNRGVPITAVVADLGSSVPADGVTGGSPPPPPTCGVKGDSCSTGSECCSGKCTGKPGNQTCK